MRLVSESGDPVPSTPAANAAGQGLGYLPVATRSAVDVQASLQHAPGAVAWSTLPGLVLWRLTRRAGGCPVGGWPAFGRTLP